LAGALAALGSTHALIVHGEPGMDEISPVGPTHVAEVRDGEVKEWVMDPGHFGFNGIATDDLAGGDPTTNARIIEAVLAGEGPAGAEGAVLLNAAAAIYVSGMVETMDDALAKATEALSSGAGRRALDRLRQAYVDAKTTS
jgi:anthranilate phosphoribosyltransferase